MSDIVEKIQKLIALAGSDNEHEARNAAMLACRLIREHKIPIGERGSQPFRRPDVGGIVDLTDFFNTVMNQARSGSRVNPDLGRNSGRPFDVRADTFHQDVEFERKMRAEDAARRAANAPPMRKRSEAGRKR